MSPTTIEPSLRAIIVDDEFRSRSSLRILLDHHFPQVGIVGEAESVAAAVNITKEKQPELVFLDIELPDGSAFDYLELVADRQIKVIVVSAHPQHSVRAFRYATVHYLLKPIELGDLREAIARVSKSSAREAAKAVANPRVTDSIALPSIEGFKMASIQDIVYLEADSNYTIFHFRDKSSYVVSNTLGYYEDLLADKPFYRVHHKFLIHFAHITAYHRGRGGWAEMSNGTQVEVSSRKRDGFLQKLTEFTRGI